MFWIRWADFYRGYRPWLSSKDYNDHLAKWQFVVKRLVNLLTVKCYERFVYLDVLKGVCRHGKMPNYVRLLCVYFDPKFVICVICVTRFLALGDLYQRDLFHDSWNYKICSNGKTTQFFLVCRNFSSQCDRASNLTTLIVAKRTSSLAFLATVVFLFLVVSL